MANYLKKHKILSALKEKWDTEQRNLIAAGLNDAPIYDLSLHTDDLAKSTKIEQELISDLLVALSIENFVEISEQKPRYYWITAKGMSVVTDKTLLNKVWWRNTNFWKWAIPFVISLAALANSIFHWWET